MFRKNVEEISKEQMFQAVALTVKDEIIDDWIDMGVSLWEPAQVGNDLLAVQKKYHGKLAFAGGWDNQGRISFPETPDEELAQAVRDYIDR